ncbi:MAG: ribulose-phosphate 3-epimerase [Blastopirellula sp.]|nr:MAG: ribulose-phosphate 3-epimerase [Blastopirellula sp.]
MTFPLHLGVKTDPIEYRYSHPWLFRLLAEEGIDRVQIGTHFEMYQLPDEFFHELRKQAEDHGINITSMFTAHRELGGFFRTEPGYEQVARANYERYIQIGGILGANSVGSNPGAVMRDLMGTKPDGVACYIKHMKELMHVAKENGLDWLTIEPMSCLAEPPTLPAENESMGRELTDYHRANPDSTVQVGYCTDIAHGYINQQDEVEFNHIELYESTVPYLYELHLKNTDDRFNSTFGFTEEERNKGIVDVPHFRELLLASTDKLPVSEMTGYLEIGGPKLGRDYTDCNLEDSLRESLRYLKTAWLGEDAGSSSSSIAAAAVAVPESTTGSDVSTKVEIAPSMMCVDAMNFESALRQVEALGVDMLHMDIMDGHFVPNMSMGLATLEQVRAKTELPLDVHLMVADNDFFIEVMKDYGVDRISVHLESCTHLDRTLARIRELGIQAGVAINPATPLEAIEYVLERIDYVLLMTVNPGYAGQKMTPASIRKIADCKAMLEAHEYDLPIQVDGNVSFDNIPAMVAAGADNLVAGTSSIFHKSASWKDNVVRMQQVIDQGFAMKKQAVDAS